MCFMNIYICSINMKTCTGRIHTNLREWGGDSLGRREGNRLRSSYLFVMSCFTI